MDNAVEARPHRPITVDDIARLNVALEKVNGHRKHAATLLGWTERRVYDMISDRPELRARWSKKPETPPADVLADDIDRPPTDLPQFSRDEKKAALALQRQDEMLQQTWEKSGFDERQRDFLSTLQNSYAINLKSTVDLTYGGMVHTATRLLLLFEDLVQKIRDIDANPGAYERSHQTEFGSQVTKSAHEFRCELYDRLISISAEMRKVHTDVNKAQYVRAQLEALRRGGTPNGKPGFVQGVPPTAVQINVNGTVAVSEPKPVDDAGPND